VPFGGGGNKELITVTKDRGKQFLNLIGKARYSVEDGIDTLIILTIAEDDQGTRDMIDTWSAITIAKDGLGRAEHIMLSTGVVAPKSMPTGVGEHPEPPAKPSRTMPWNRTNGHHQEEEIGVN